MEAADEPTPMLFAVLEMLCVLKSRLAALGVAQADLGASMVFIAASAGNLRSLTGAH